METKCPKCGYSKDEFSASLGRCFCGPALVKKVDKPTLGISLVRIHSTNPTAIHDVTFPETKYDPKARENIKVYNLAGYAMAEALEAECRWVVEHGMAGKLPYMDVLEIDGKQWRLTTKTYEWSRITWLRTS